MDSILNNSAALSALQSLQMTQQSLATVQNEVSTGLAVASASDNSSYWSISQQLNSDSSVVTASQSALSEGQSVLSTATSALNSVITTLNSMATSLTQAQNPGANLGDINTSLASLGQQLTDAVNGASFNGLNILNGSQTAMTYVSGYNASATGGALNTINFMAQALTGASSKPYTTTSTISDGSTIASLQALTANTGPLAVGNDVITFSTAAVGAPDTLTIQSEDAAGDKTTTVYTALDANGNALTDGNFKTDAIGSLAVSTTITPATASSTTTTTSTLTDATAMSQLQALENANSGDTTASKVSITAPTATYGEDAYYYDAANQAFTVQSMALDGTVTTTTYTALDASANSIAQGATIAAFNNAASYAVTSTVTANPTNLLVQNGVDLTALGSSSGTTVTLSTASTALAAVNQALAVVQNYSAYIGATQDRMTAASTFNSDLTTNYSNGVAGLVDADMNTASTQLQALQTQEQLGIQSLSIANQNAQLILKLFGA